VVDVAWDYPDFHLEMACFLCHIKEGAPRLVEHEAAVWLDPQDIDSVDWLDADVLVVNALKDQGIV
jgi:8-oxo-dGTP diphosphatase